MIKQKSFTQYRNDKVENGILNVTQNVVYSFLAERMESSRRHGLDFYDKKRGSYYIVFSQKEMADKLKLSRATVNTIYKVLESVGLIIKAHRFNNADRLYMPEFEGLIYCLGQNISRPNVKILESNQLTLNQKTFRFTSNTINTRAAELPADKSVAQESEDQAPTQDPKTEDVSHETIYDHSTERINHATMESLMDSLTTRTNIPADAVQIMADLSYNDPAELYNFGGLVNKAKATQAKSAESALGHRGFQALRFETNNILRDGFKSAIQRIIIAANKKCLKGNQGTSSAKINRDKYVFASLVNYFGEVANEWLVATA